MAGFIENYQKTHTHPVNKVLHTVGIPLIVVSLIVVFFHWQWGATLFLLGWILQFVGHAFEGKPPAFFSNPVYLIIGPLWWALKIFGVKPKNADDHPSSNER